jgi:hypothetical protein
MEISQRQSFGDSPPPVAAFQTIGGNMMESSECEGTIISSLQSSVQIQEYADDDGVADLLQPGCVTVTGDGA